MNFNTKRYQLKRRIALSRYNWLLVKPFLPFIHIPTNKCFIFIVGCYNSGTTLLDHVLGSHKEISNLPTEGWKLTSQLKGPEDFGWPRMWHKCRENIRLEENDSGPNVGRILKEWSFWYETSRPLFVEKSVPNGARIRWLRKNFNDPYFIWIIRNGYCVAEGIRRRTKKSKTLKSLYKEDGYPIDMCARQWVVNNVTIEQDTQDSGKLLSITYEDLVDKTHDTVKRILDWLPVKDKKVPPIKPFLFNDTNFNLREKAISNMNQSSLRRLSLDDIMKINMVAGQYLKKWGYDLFQP